VETNVYSPHAPPGVQRCNFVYDCTFPHILTLPHCQCTPNCTFPHILTFPHCHCTPNCTGTPRRLPTSGRPAPLHRYTAHGRPRLLQTARYKYCSGSQDIRPPVSGMWGIPQSRHSAHIYADRTLTPPPLQQDIYRCTFRPP
jgi:hypothetical protein